MVFEGMIELWQTADGVIRACALVLFVMSVLSWTVMLVRAWQYWAYARVYLGATSNMPAGIKEAQKIEETPKGQNLALQTAVDEEGLRLSGGLVIPAMVGVNRTICWSFRHRLGYLYHDGEAGRRSAYVDDR